MNWYLDALKNYAVFKGRSQRKAYWFFQLVSLTIAILLAVIDAATGNVYGPGLGLLTGLYTLAIIVPAISVTVRRLHDSGRSGWWCFIGLVPIIGGFVLLIFMVLDSDPNANVYGPNPKSSGSNPGFENAENPDSRTVPLWRYFVGIPAGLIIFSLTAYGLLAGIGIFPSTEVLAGAKLPDSQLQTLVSENIIDEGETVEYFYSQGLLSILEDGNLLTDRRVISFFENDENELEIYELYFPEIYNVELLHQGSSLEDSVYQVNAYEEDVWLQVFLSTEARGDVRFIEALENKIDKARLEAVFSE